MKKIVLLALALLLALSLGATIVPLYILSLLKAPLKYQPATNFFLSLLNSDIYSVIPLRSALYYGAAALLSLALSLALFWRMDKDKNKLGEFKLSKLEKCFMDFMNFAELDEKKLEGKYENLEKNVKVQRNLKMLLLSALADLFFIVPVLVYGIGGNRLLIALGNAAVSSGSPDSGQYFLMIYAVALVGFLISFALLCLLLFSLSQFLAMKALMFRIMRTESASTMDSKPKKTSDWHSYGGSWQSYWSFMLCVSLPVIVIVALAPVAIYYFYPLLYAMFLLGSYFMLLLLPAAYRLACRTVRTREIFSAYKNAFAACIQRKNIAVMLLFSAASFTASAYSLLLQPFQTAGLQYFPLAFSWLLLVLARAAFAK